MREPACCVEVRRRLVRHGLPRKRLERVVGELSDHWLDLRFAAMEQGVPCSEAERRADLSLGRPQDLAREAVAGWQRSSWLARHPIVALLTLPLLLPLLVMIAIAAPVWWLDQWLQFATWRDAAGRLDAGFVSAAIQSVYCAGMFLTPVALCGWAWRAGLGLRWVVAICLWCALASLLRSFEIDLVKRNASIALRFPCPLNFQTSITLLGHALLSIGFFVVSRRNGTTPQQTPTGPFSTQTAHPL